ncbi:enoyl-ACP reductase FabI [Meridianimarinicoccus aquatilis]|uniref:Enoyl-[acyl-carrier-protein] reductase [NADH] n=1 Tax=Meridianimarinicoccus aquatilis TaxID=2552766 RepID=A0A4R6B560_9RHOB|nr:enoyl-ACP reductase FabI [Fluviibacterium aquatile]QIE43731.1 enoyl-ACP reductase FabI [Rhodobacteraceae bacterium SC52]TDL90393.1 enoyl-[acyl-carrier-protein] reductase FabI [Fluviibacterium aquatile]
MFSLEGRKALIVGVANDHSIAYGVAKALRAQGADIAITYLNSKAEPYVRPLAEALDASLFLPLDVTDDAQTADVFKCIAEKWGKLDILVHSVAFCPLEDLHGRVVDVSRGGFGQAMDISVHSFLRMIRLAEPLMPDGGTCMTVSFQGSGKVVDNYNIMGPVKAALESVTRYAAAELGPKGISVHALSPGPMATRAASGLSHFDALLADASSRAPTHHVVTIDEVGAYAAFLSSREASSVTGGVHMIDGGYSIVA